MIEHDVIPTKYGQIDVEHGDERVVVTFHGNNPEKVRTYFSQNGVPRLVIWEGKRPPRIGDEVTQNGRTFEVTGVRKAEGGVVMLLPDNGVWETWVEA